MMLFEKFEINYFENNLLYGKALIWSVCVCMSARVHIYICDSLYKISYILIQLSSYGF